MIVFSACLPGSFALAKDSVAGPTPVVVGALSDWPPYYTTDNSGNPNGLAIDVMDAVAARSNLAVTYKIYPDFAQMISALSRGEIDVIANMGEIDSRNLYFSHATDVFKISLFVRSTHPGVKNIKSLANSKIGVVTSNVGIDIVSQMPDKPDIKVYDNARLAIFGLLAGEVDGLIYPAPVIDILARAAGVTGRLREVGPALREVKRAIAVAPRNTALLQRINQGLEGFVGSSEYAEIYARWRTPPPPYWTAGRVAKTAAWLLATAIILLMLWRYVSIRRLGLRLQFQSRLLDVIDSGVVAVDGAGFITYWNPHATELIGMDRKTALGKQLASQFVADKSFHSTQFIAESLRKGERWSGEVQVLRQDGASFPALVSSVPVLDQRGNYNGFVAAFSDISTMKQLELQLRQSQKMEALGRLAGGIAHDFNNILTIIHGNTMLAMDSMPADDPGRDDLSEVINAADLAASLVRQLLGFSKRQMVEPRVVDVYSLVREFEPLVARVLQKSITFELAGAPGACFIRIDPVQLEQVILNLAVNASDAMPDGGRFIVTIKTSVFANGHPGDFVEMRISDTGEGIPEEVQEKVFEPFFTTKDASKGTGLGLALVHGIVHQSGGLIDLESRTGVGTTFHLYFPRVEREQVDVEDENDREDRKTVFVVEDERSVRELIVRILARAGYETLEAHNAMDVLERFEELSSASLVVTDVVMQGMQGTEMVREIRRMLPELPILFVTGYPHHDVFKQTGELHVLTKPFDQQALVNKVRELTS